MLSVVIPVLDEERDLELCVRSCRDAGVLDVVVVDGGSTDRSVEVARAAGARVITAKRGRGTQLKAGLEHAKGEVICFLHGDTRLPVGGAQEIIAAIEGGSVGGAFRLSFAGASRGLGMVAFGINLRSRLGAACTGDQAQFFLRSALCAAGGVPDVPLAEDLLMWRAVKRHGALHLVDAHVVTSGRRFEEHGIVSTLLCMWRIRIGLRLGVSPTMLARLYRSRRAP